MRANISSLPKRRPKRMVRTDLLLCQRVIACFLRGSGRLSFRGQRRALGFQGAGLVQDIARWPDSICHGVDRELKSKNGRSSYHRRGPTGPGPLVIDGSGLQNCWYPNPKALQGSWVEVYEVSACLSDLDVECHAISLYHCGIWIHDQDLWPFGGVLRKELQ